MQVVITGGTGLIGQALANHLLQHQYEVIVLSRNKNQTAGLDHGVKVVEWDAKTADGWLEYADGATAIVNLAGASVAGDSFLPARWSGSRKKAILESRLNAGKAVVDAVRKATVKPKVLIQSSAVGYYGNHPMDVVLTEDSPAGDDFLAKLCQQWEASTEAVEDVGVRRVVIRTGLVMSTKGGVYQRLVLPFKLFAGGTLGDGKQPQPWIHIDDQVNAMRFLIENESAYGVYNFTAPNPVTNKELASVISKTLQRPNWLPVPSFAFKLGFGEVSSIVLEGQNVIPKRLLEAGYHFQYEQVEEAVQALTHDEAHDAHHEESHAH